MGGDEVDSDGRLAEEAALVSFGGGDESFDVFVNVGDIVIYDLGLGGREGSQSSSGRSQEGCKLEMHGKLNTHSWLERGVTYSRWCEERRKQVYFIY